MTKIILSKPPGLVSVILFYRDRAARIIPALFVLVAVCLAAGLFLIDPLQMNRLQKEVGYAITFLSNFHYYKSIGYFDPKASANWLLHTWSLSVEWQFYLLYPIVVMAASRLFGRRAVPLVILGLLLASLALTLVLPDKRATFAFYLLPCRAWEMAAGGLAYLFAGRRPQILDTRPAIKMVSVFAGLAVLLGSALLIPEEVRWPSAWTILPVAASAYLLFAEIDVSRWALYRPLSYVGLWSYSIYLWHWPVLRYLTYLDPDLKPAQQAIGIILSTALGCLSYTLIERRSGRWLVSLTAPRFAATAMGAAVLLTVGILGERAIVDARAPRDVWKSYIDAHNDLEPSVDCIFRSGHEAPCVIKGATGVSHRILVIGDSHAQMWLPRLRQAAALGAGEIEVTALHGCPVLPKLNTGVRPCSAFNRQAFALADSGKFDRVIYISLWNYLDDKASLCIDGPKGCAPVTDLKQLAPVLAQFSDEIGRLRAKGVDVTITLPPLNAHDDIPVGLARARQLGDGLQDLSTDKRGDQERKRSVAANYLRALAAAHDVRLLDPLDMFCGPLDCSYVDGQGRPYFKDSNHVRPSFIGTSRFLDPALGVGPAS